MRNCVVGTFDGRDVTVYAGKVRTASNDAVPSTAGSPVPTPTTGPGHTEGGLDVVRPGEPDRWYPVGSPDSVKIVGVRGATLLLHVGPEGKSGVTRVFDLATGSYTPPS